MSPAAAPERQADATQLVEDLEELAVAGAIDDVAVRMVREALFAIADRVRELPDADGLVSRDDVLALIEPGRRL